MHKKWSLWCLLQDEHLETDCGKTFKVSNHCPRLFNSQRFANSHRSGTGYRLVWAARPNLPRTTVSGDPIPVCRECTLPRANPLSRASAAILGETTIGPVIEVHVVQVFGTMDLKSKFHLQIIHNGHLGFWYPKERVDSWTNCISQMSDIISPARNCCLNQKTRKKVNLAWRSGRQAQGNLLRPLLQVIAAPENWTRTLSAFLSVQCTRRTIPTKEGKLKILPAYSSYKGGSLSTAISKMVTRLVRHHDQEERQSDAAVHWDTTRTIAESVRGRRSTRFLRNRLASTHRWRKEQDEVRVLRGFQTFLDLFFEQFKDTLEE